MPTIRAWLESIGLGQYADAFEAEAISITNLADLTDGDLKDLGLPLGPRKTLLKAARSIDAQAMPAPTGETRSAPAARADGRRQITVMFCDMVGSTKLSEQLDPEDLRALMQDYQQACGAVIARYEGHVAQYLGDGLMTYFGWPAAHEDDAERAVRAALEIIAAVKKVASPVPLRVKIGMATGAVVVGETGAGDASAPKMAVGETPNVAARVQALAEADHIMIAESTRHLLRNRFKLNDLGAVALKGIAEPVRVWAVVGLAENEGRFYAHTQQFAPLVGRDEELSLLLRSWHQARDGEGRVVLLGGESGMGKSRLVHALLERIADEPHVRMRYQCSSYHTNSALHPIIEHLEHAIKATSGEATSQLLDKLEALLGQGTTEVAQVAPLFAALLSIDCGERYPSPPMSPVKQKEETLKALASQVLGVASRQPVLMMFEDVHWVDPSTLDLLDLLVPMMATSRVLLVINYRPGRQLPWTGYDHVVSLALTRLGRAQACALAAKASGGVPLPDAVLDRILAKADGVPLFVEELTKTMIEGGLLKRGATGFELSGELSRLAIPSSLQDSLMARLDRLPPNAKEVAQIGACIGREFSYALIAAVARLSDDVLDNALEQLFESEVVLRKGKRPETVYTFRHALIQDAAYESLLRARRRGLHGAIALAMEQSFPVIADAQPQILAQHYSIAGMADKAVANWLEAGKRAARVSANAEAFADLKQGLEQLNALPESGIRDRLELDLNMALINPLIAVKGYSAPETKAVSERALTLCRQTGQASRIFPALSAQWVYHYVSGDILRCEELAVDYTELADSHQERVPRLVGYRLMGISSLIGGTPTAAFQHFERAWALFDPSSDAEAALNYGQDFGVSLGNYLAWVASLCGYPDRAHRWGQEALSRARAIDHGNTLAFSLHLIAMTAFLLRDREALEHHTAALQTFSKKLGLPIFQAVGLAFQGLVLGLQERPQEGLAKVEEGITLAGSIQFKIYTPVFLVIRVRLLRELGRVDDALAAIAQGFSVISSTQEHWGDPELHRICGDLHAVLSRPSEAESEYMTALTAAREQQAKLWELRTSVSLGRLWRSQGKIAQARELLTSIYGWFAEGFDTKDLREARSLLDELAA